MSTTFCFFDLFDASEPGSDFPQDVSRGEALRAARRYLAFLKLDMAEQHRPVSQRSPERRR